MKVDNSDRLFAQITPSNADDRVILWSSENDSIAEVDANGNVTAKKSGEVWIYAISQDNVEAKDSCKVVVIQPVTGVSVSENSYQLEGIGSSVQLEAFVEPNDASNQEVRWKSTNEGVCVVSNGKVVSVGYGIAVILVSTVDGGFLASCTITVTEATNIREVQNDDIDAPLYDTTGRRISTKKPNTIYIQNGKKVIKK